MTPCSLSVKRKRRDWGKSITMRPGGGREDPFVFKYFLTITAAASWKWWSMFWIHCLHAPPPPPSPPPFLLSPPHRVGTRENGVGREGARVGRKWSWIEYVYYHIVATSWNSLFQVVSITVWGGLNWLRFPSLYYIGLWHHLLQLMKKHTTSYTKCCVGLKYSTTKPNQSACENLSHLLKDWHFPSPKDSLIKLHIYHT